MMSCDLCEELILEIFSRLPTKSLLRFRSVSKSLYACIGSRRFIRMHTLRSQNKVMILHQVEYEEHMNKNMYTLNSGDQLSHFDIAPIEYPFVNYIIVGSCNGVLCLHHYLNGGCLWNPSIRRKVTVRGLAIRSDCKSSFYPIGFGFDPVTDDYKILMRAISDTTIGDEPGAFVYTVKTDAWREIPSPTGPYYEIKSLQCLLNGSLHWIAKGFLTDSRDDALSYSYIMKFDLSSEVFSTIELPELSWGAEQVTIIEGCLAVVSSKHGYYWIWVMKDNTAASWSVAFKLKSDEFGWELKRVFQLSPKGDLVINPFFNGIIMYNPETGARSRFVRLRRSCSALRVTPCVESIELLDMGTTLCEANHQEKEENQNK